MEIKKTEIDYIIEEGNLIVEAEFKPKFNELLIRCFKKDEDEKDGKKTIFYSATFENSQDLNDFTAIMLKINTINLENGKEDGQ